MTMTTNHGRRAGRALAIGLGAAAAAGCGEPPPMVSMGPPGTPTQVVAIDTDSDQFRATAVGEEGLSRSRADELSDAGGDPSDQAPPCEPTAIGEEAVTDSGLTYSTLEAGDDGAPIAEVGDAVVVRYTGTLEDGEVFDRTDEGETARFDLRQGALIDGWVEGMAGMRVGERRRLVVPPDLAYGSAGRPGIPPNATLTFEVELVDLIEPSGG